jgi:hypothetical protein
MISDASLETEHAIELYRAAFREDVAEQLRLAAERAGLSSSVTVAETKIALEIAGSGSDGDGLRVVACFNDAREVMPGWCDWITLSAETADGRTPLLTLAWRDDEGLSGAKNLRRRLAEWEARVDRDLPLDRRGLNAKTDVRAGRYGRSSVPGALLRDLQSAAGAAMGHEPRAVALRLEPVTVLRREDRSANAPVVEPYRLAKAVVLDIVREAREIAGAHLRPGLCYRHASSGRPCSDRNTLVMFIVPGLDQERPA